jgi:hypothetical protein
MKWIIVDWTNTRCYSNKKFKSYEDAWEFLYSEYPAVDGDDRDDELGEYYVVKETTAHREYIGGFYLSTN